MFMTPECANAWADHLDHALAPDTRCRLTEQQTLFLSGMLSGLREKGPGLPITTRELASMKYLAKHAMEPELAL